MSVAKPKKVRRRKKKLPTCGPVHPAAKKKRKRKKKGASSGAHHASASAAGTHPASASKKHKSSAEARKRSHRKRRRCVPRKHKPKRPHPTPLTGSTPPSGMHVEPPATSPAPTAPPPAPPPVQPPAPGPLTPMVIAPYEGAFGAEQAQRLLFRAAFGPLPGQTAQVASMGLEGAVRWLTRPQGAAQLIGPEPRQADGSPYEPYDIWGHDHVMWFDRMIRSNQPLVERMALVFHDWFATVYDVVGRQNFTFAQIDVFRRYAFGSFRDLLHDITIDPAMIIFLSTDRNSVDEVNENYAREVMELFTLGANRGAYTEHDIRELGRAFTGWQSFVDAHNVATFEFVPARHDTGLKTVFGKTGNYDWQDACRMVVEHPMHPSFFVNKLWSYFIPDPPSDAERTALERLYVSSGMQVRPILENILRSRSFYESRPMMKPPVVYAAGLQRGRRRYVGPEAMGWLFYVRMSGQQLFHPPDVSGWNDKAWIDTNTIAWRWTLASQILFEDFIPGPRWGSYDPNETAELALQRATAYWGDVQLSSNTYDKLLAFAARNGTHISEKAQRQNLLRQLVASSPDLQVC